MNLTEACFSAHMGNFISHTSFDNNESMHAYNGQLFYEDGPNLSVNGGIDFLEKEDWAQKDWYVKYPAERVDRDKLKQLHEESNGRMISSIGKSYEECIITDENNESLLEIKRSPAMPHHDIILAPITRGTPSTPDDQDIWLAPYRMSLYSYRNTNNWLKMHGKKMRTGNKKKGYHDIRRMEQSRWAHFFRTHPGAGMLPGDFDGDLIPLPYDPFCMSGTDIDGDKYPFKTQNNQIEVLKTLAQGLKELARESCSTPKIYDYYFSQKHSEYLNRNMYPPSYIEIDGETYETTECIYHGHTPLSADVWDDVKFIGSK